MKGQPVLPIKEASVLLSSETGRWLDFTGDTSKRLEFQIALASYLSISGSAVVVLSVLFRTRCLKVGSKLEKELFRGPKILLTFCS